MLLMFNHAFWNDRMLHNIGTGEQSGIKNFEKGYGVDYEILYTEVSGDSVEYRNEISIYVEDYME